jgi:C4-dicarboxylate-specific signal transduction histidine kinase
VIARVVDPFFTTKDVGEGTGLGLWITDSIVRAHGGTLVWGNRAGAGAEFIVTLPVK